MAVCFEELVARNTFESLVDEYYADNVSKMLWTYKFELEVVQHINGAKLAIELGRKPSRLQWFYSKLYDVLSIDGVERVIVKKARQDGSVRVMLAKEEFFEVISSYHERMGHAGLDKLCVAVRQRFVIPKPIIVIFVNCCKICSTIKSGNAVPDNEEPTFTPAECARKNWESLQAKFRERETQFMESQCSGEHIKIANNALRTRNFQVPQIAPAQKQPNIQPPQQQTPKVLPPQQVQAPKPIAPKPPQIAQPVSPLQPLPPPPEVCLRWNSYHSNMQATFPSLLNNEQFVDVTLACEGRSIKCHKMMLSACSAYFEELLSQNPCQHPIVLMKDLRYWEVQALVDFMYRGEVNVGQDKLPSLLAAAEALQIKGLAGPAFSSNDDDNSQAPAPASTNDDYLDESVPSPSSARRARKRRVMSSNVSPRVQPTQPQPISTSTKNTSGKRSVKPFSIPSTSSASYELENTNIPSEPPTRRQRKSDADLVGEIKIEPIDIEISNDSMDQIEDNFLDKPYDESEAGEESNCLSNDPGGTTDNKSIDLGDTMKSLHGHESDQIDYGTNNSTSGSDQNFKFEDSRSQEAALGTISDLPGTSYQESLPQPSSSGMNNSSSISDSLLGHM